MLFLAFGMCMMLASLLAGGYVLLNKPQATESQPLLSAEDLEALAGKLDEAKDAVQYSNVLDARIGFDSGTITKTTTLAPADCEALCTGTGKCEGYQIYGQNGCDLLANVSGTYAFTETGYNLFTTPVKIPQKAFGGPNQGEISGRDVTAAPGSSAMSDIRTKHECAKACHDAPACKSFSVSPTDGCFLKSALNVGDATLVPHTGWESYFTAPVAHTNGWSWATPAPAPSST